MRHAARIATALCASLAIGARANASATSGLSSLREENDVTASAVVLEPDGSRSLTPRARRASGLALTEPELLTRATRAARAACERLDVDFDELERTRVAWLPLGLVGSVDKFAVAWRQRHAGVEVEGGLCVLLDRFGRVLTVDCALPAGAELASHEPVVDARTAQERARAAFAELTRAEAELVGAPGLLHARDPLRPERRELAWCVLARTRERDRPRRALELRVSAHDGKLVSTLDRELRYDVTGAIGGWISPGVLPDGLNHAAIAQSACTPCATSTCGACPPTSCAVPACGPDCSPEIAVPLPDLEVEDAQGNVVHTSADGSFRLPGNAPVQITLRFRGRHVRVADAQGNDFVLTLPLAQDSGNRIVLGGPAPYSGSELLTAQANAYTWITRLRAWIARTNPADLVWESDPFPKIARVNVAQVQIGCGGEFDLPPLFPTVSGGPEVLFSVGGGPCGPLHPTAGCGCCGSSDGTCTNKANATYLAHEMGHWMNLLYLDLRSASAFNEALADVWSMYLTGDPRLFPFDCSAQTCLRSGENCRQFTTYADQFVGDTHKKGEVLMGALWRVRALLEASGSASGGAEVAHALFLAWITSFPEFEIHQGIQRRWLLLDDDDADPSTPTPHQAAIVAGFTSHGL